MTKKIECLLALTALAWGTVVLNPWADTFSTSVTFRVMAGLGSEIAWGSTLTVIGILGILINNNGSFKKRRWIAAINSISWMIISILYFMGNPYGTGFIPYLFLSLIGLVTFVDIKTR